MDTRFNFRYYDFFGYPNDVERQKETAENVRKQPPYFAIGLPTDHVTYEQPGINPKYKNCPCLMSMAIFKIVSFTPAKLKKTLFSGTVIDTYPQVIFETMDGRRMNAFELYEYKRAGGETAYAYVLTREVLKELEKTLCIQGSISATTIIFPVNTVTRAMKPKNMLSACQDMGVPSPKNTATGKRLHQGLNSILTIISKVRTSATTRAKMRNSA